MVTNRTVLLLLAVLLVSCRQSPAPEGEAPLQGAGPTSAADGAGETKEAKEPGQPHFELNARDSTPVEANIVQVRLSNQGSPESDLVGAETTRFEPTDTVYAMVETNGKRGGYTLYAKWIASDGGVLSEYGTRVADAGAQRTVVSLSKPDGWVRGKYTIELAINSQQGRQVSFEVQ